MTTATYEPGQPFRGRLEAFYRGVLYGLDGAVSEIRHLEYGGHISRPVSFYLRASLCRSHAEDKDRYLEGVLFEFDEDLADVYTREGEEAYEQLVAAGRWELYGEGRRGTWSLLT